MYIRVKRKALLLVATLFVVAPVLGQDAQEPPTIFMTSWKCDRAAVGDLVEAMKTRDMVIAQELVDEGAMWQYHVMVHEWGDEWNVVDLLVADDVARGVAANDSFATRFEARFGEDTVFEEHCETHRDNIYTGTYITETPEGQMFAPPYSVLMSSFACPFNAVDGIIEDTNQTLFPAAQASVNEGKGYMMGGMRHAWADEWNYIIFGAAADVPGLIAFNGDVLGRVTSPAASPLAVCDHKDGFYRMVLETTAPTQ